MDGPASRILKVAAHVIAPNLNKVITTEMFPTLWKLARMCPILESGKPFVKIKYRPISILCTLLNIIERHVH